MAQAQHKNCMDNKRRIFIPLFLFIGVFETFATNCLDVRYVSEKIKINQFLCYYENLQTGEVSYEMLEKKFYDFCYLADSLLAISSKIGKPATFYSESGISELDIGEKSFLFVSKSRESEVKASTENYVLTENYNEPHFIISFVCNDLHLKMPNPKNRKLYSLETKSNSKSMKTSQCFFCRAEQCPVRHVLNLEKKIISAFIIRKMTRWR